MAFGSGFGWAPIPVAHRWEITLWPQGSLYASFTSGFDKRSSGNTSNMVETEINLNGEWIGYDPSHFDEVVRITQSEEHVDAVKVTGDD